MKLYCVPPCLTKVILIDDCTAVLGGVSCTQCDQPLQEAHLDGTTHGDRSRKFPPSTLARREEAHTAHDRTEYRKTLHAGRILHPEGSLWAGLRSSREASREDTSHERVSTLSLSTL